jgi:O-acetyl-ADP-ribose deacetylase (regulator of RNase III)
MKELGAYSACPAGSAVVTGAGLLPAKYVFHAVGPIYQDGTKGEAEVLASAYRSCLRLGTELGVSSISFPSISTGAYGYPVAEAARIAVNTVKETSIPLVLFVLFDERTLKAYKAALE